jgi:hypothetical protein
MPILTKFDTKHSRHVLTTLDGYHYYEQALQPGGPILL